MAIRPGLPGPLVSVDDLARHLDDPGVVIADVRWVLGQPGAGRLKYDTGHIPGAIYLDTDVDLVGPEGPGRHPLPDPAVFAQRLAAAGIGDETFVVAYDDVGGWVAARLWWMLDDLGHSNVAVLDGGWQAWTAAGLPTDAVEPEAPTRPPSLSLAHAWRKVIDRDALKPKLGSFVLLDARAGERYRGEIEPIDPVAGHIPTAKSAPTGGNIGPDMRFLEPSVLRARFESLGCFAPGGTVTSCGSGVSACHNALAMRIAGLPDPILYPGSYSDWSRSGELVAVGADPGTVGMVSIETA
jgi:thiosulfate/3-mercaptopyruvate sulfurtransferase